MTLVFEVDQDMGADSRIEYEEDNVCVTQMLSICRHWDSNPPIMQHMNSGAIDIFYCLSTLSMPAHHRLDQCSIAHQGIITNSGLLSSL
jgi:hypothetical protein